MAAASTTGGSFPLGMGGPGVGMAAVTPTDTDNIVASGYARALYVTGAGAVHAKGLDGQDFTVTLPANFILPVAVTKVYNSGTTAANIFAIW